MNIQIQTPHVRFNEELNEVITQKLEKAFDTYPFITNCKVFLKLEEQASNDRCEVEIYLHLSQKELFASNKANTFQEALPAVVDKLKRQVERYKQKVYTKP